MLERNTRKFDYLAAKRKITQEYEDTLRPVIAAWVNQKFSNISPNVAYDCETNYRTSTTKISIYTKDELINSLVDSLCIRPNIAPLSAYKTNKKYYEYKNLIAKTKSDVFLKIPFIKTQEEFDNLMNEAEQKLK